LADRERRGGARVPDGVQRPASLPFARGPNRSDLSELPGTPGTPLPPNPSEPQVQHGEAGRLRSMLGNVPLEQLSPEVGLRSPTQRPNEPITAGIDRGAGPGSDSLLSSPQQLSAKLSASQMKYAYPVILRLATLPNATTETKILAQRIRANLPVAPEHMPAQGPPNGVPRQP
jgi:hypothetical protein